MTFGPPKVGHCCPDHAQVIHAAMLKKAGIFCGEYSIPHHLGYEGVGGQLAPFFSKLSHQLAFGCEDPHRQFGAVIGQRRHLRQIWKGHRHRYGNHHQHGQQTSGSHARQTEKKYTDVVNNCPSRLRFEWVGRLLSRNCHEIFQIGAVTL